MTKHQAIPVLPVQDRIRGCLIGGAAGDALGYPVEFFSEQTLRERCGDGGIRQYLPDPVSGTARISDDTQMTLFTANGLLVGDTRMALRGIGAQPHDYVSRAYQDWLITQRTSAPARDTHASICWLMDIPALYRCRAPGSTCLSALTQQQGQPPLESYISHPQNHSKGCGGVMRVAPLGVSRYTAVPIEALDREGAELAAITHGHSLGYMPAAVLTHILHRIVYPERTQTLLQIVCEARDTVRALFAGDKHLDELTRALTSPSGLRTTTSRISPTSTASARAGSRRRRSPSPSTAPCGTRTIFPPASSPPSTTAATATRPVPSRETSSARCSAMTRSTRHGRAISSSGM